MTMIVDILKTLKLFIVLFMLVVFSGCDDNTTNSTVSNNSSIEIFNIASKKVACYGTGSYSCLVVNGETFYDNIDGFNFQQGYKYVIKVEKKEKQKPIPADGSKYTYKLVEIVSKAADIPKGCVSWFDGCNVCIISDEKPAACTKKYCPPEFTKEPECLKFGD